MTKAILLALTCSALMLGCLAQPDEAPAPVDERSVEIAASDLITPAALEAPSCQPNGTFLGSAGDLCTGPVGGIPPFEEPQCCSGYAKWVCLARLEPLEARCVAAP